MLFKECYIFFHAPCSSQPLEVRGDVNRLGHPPTTRQQLMW